MPYAIEPSWEQYPLTPSMSPNKAVLVIPAIYGNPPVPPFPQNLIEKELNQDLILSKVCGASARYARELALELIPHVRAA